MKVMVRILEMNILQLILTLLLLPDWRRDVQEIKVCLLYLGRAKRLSYEESQDVNGQSPDEGACEGGEILFLQNLLSFQYKIFRTCPWSFRSRTLMNLPWTTSKLRSTKPEVPGGENI